MNNWYEVLGVSPDATQEQIAEAFARLVPSELSENESEDEAEQRRLIEHAYGVVGDPGRRAQYDAERTAAAGPVVGSTSAPASAPAGEQANASRRRVPIGPILAGVAVIVAAAVVVVALVIVAQDDEGRAYPDRRDEEFDLEAMRLTEEDLPPGFAAGQSFEFSNEDWAGILNEEDPESAQRGLEAEGRLRNLLSVYESEQLGATLGIFSISTVYTDDVSASRSLGLYCGLPVPQTRDIRARALAVPPIGEESTGFIADGVMSSETYKEATMCFRTGRVVHAISLASIPGVEDVALAVRLAQKMETRVNDYYEGKPPAEQPEEGS